MFNLVPAIEQNITNSTEQKLVASLTLLDDDGTVVFNMTTEADYKSNLTQKFRAPHVQNYVNYNNSNLTNKISNFVTNVTT